MWSFQCDHRANAGDLLTLYEPNGKQVPVRLKVKEPVGTGLTKRLVVETMQETMLRPGLLIWGTSQMAQSVFQVLLTWSASLHHSVPYEHASLSCFLDVFLVVNFARSLLVCVHKCEGSTTRCAAAAVCVSF